METFTQVTSESTIADVKVLFSKSRPKYYADRQSFRPAKRGKPFKNEDTIESLGLKSGDTIYFKDLGPQIGWTTVFLCEYAGPLAVYWLFAVRPALIYGSAAASQSRLDVVKLAAACFSFHYMKRLFETLFVHRFSHATMPIRNLFKNCSYYWGFAGFIAYFVNHPLYTAPGLLLGGGWQMWVGAGIFAAGEAGNLSTHLAFRRLRPAGTGERRVPQPTATDPFTWLFALVSCPNYTYEVTAWLGFSLMTQCLPALLFTAAGFYQMSVWALGKHRAYKREFPAYPRGRRAIIPFIL